MRESAVLEGSLASPSATDHCSRPPSTEGPAKREPLTAVRVESFADSLGFNGG